MERLTKRHVYDGKNYISVDSEKNGIPCSNYCTSCGKADCEDIRKALFKLAVYEDLQDRLDRQFNGHVSMDMIIDAIIEYDKQSGRDGALADAMLITNESVHKYREWKSLEEQGRMLKLPCAVGDTVYCIMTGVRGINATIFSLKFDHSMIEYFGKTVFLSRSEAEAALKEIISQTEI